MRGRRWLVAGTVAVIAAAVVAVALRCDRAPSDTRGGSADPRSGSSTSATSTMSRVRGDAGALPRPPLGGLRLEGQVIDEADQPVAGATVRFYNFDPETVTDEDGSFVFEHLAAHDNYQLTASKGEDTYCEMVRATLSDTSEPVILRLHPGATATVHVVDADGGKPIAGARLGDRTTDVNGDVRVHGLRPGGNNLVIIGIEADGYEQTRVKISNLDLANPADNVFRVELRRGAPVRGTVVGPSGEPIADASVNAGRSEATTDATGAWMLTLSPGAHELEASATDYIASQPITIETDGVHPRDGVTFRLQPMPKAARARPTLTGIVVDEGGKPVAAADVLVESDNMSWHEETDGEGRFSVQLGAGATVAIVTARKGDLASTATTVDMNEPARIVIARTSIAGIVVDTHGRPAPGIRVFLRTIMIDAHAVSDAKGRFELTGLSPGDYELLVAHRETEYSMISQGVVASTGARDVKLVVTDVGSISGRVVLDGKPVPYFGVYVPDADQTLDNPIIVRSSDGRFTIKGLVAGTWTLLVAGPSFGRKTIKGIAVPEDGETDLGDIVVDRGRSVRGRVTDLANTPVAGATVTIHDSDSPRDALTRAVQGTGIATTDAAGAFRISGLAPPLYDHPRRIVASHPTRGVSVERVLPADVTEANLVLLKPGAIDGRLDGAETGIFCHRVDDPSFTYSTSPDKAGRFHFENLPSGAYRLRPNALTSATALVTVVGGQRAKALLAVPPERIELQVIAGSCSKTLSLSTEDGLDAVAEQACDSPVFSAVPPGTYRACVDEKKCAPVTVQTAPAKQSITVR